MRIKIAALAVSVLGLVSFSANAVVVTQCGNDVCFTYDKDTLFGEGTIIGNNIFFTPGDFLAESLNGEGVVTSNETLNVDVASKIEGQQWIEGVALIEQGDYRLDGTGASVDVSGQLSVTSNTKLDPDSALPPLFPDPISPYRIEEFFDAGTFADTGGALAGWSADALVDLSTAAGWDTDSDVNVTIENLLSATTLNDAEQAFVQKKFGVIGISVVPLPGAVFLFPSALVALAWFRRRRGIA